MDSDEEDYDEPIAKRKREPDTAEECPTLMSPVKFKVSVASRNAFKTPFKSPIISSPLANSSPNLTASGTRTTVLNSPVLAKKPLSSGAGSRQLGGLSSSSRRTSVDPTALKTKIFELRAKELQMDLEIATLENTGLNEQDLQKFMNQMHDYNELKDAAQTTFGRLSNIRQCMIRDVYKDLGLELDD